MIKFSKKEKILEKQKISKKFSRRNPDSTMKNFSKKGLYEEYFPNPNPNPDPNPILEKGRGHFGREFSNPNPNPDPNTFPGKMNEDTLMASFLALTLTPTQNS